MKRASLADLLGGKGGYFPQESVPSPEYLVEEEYLEDALEEPPLEEEMPGSSIQVLPDDTNHLPMFATYGALEEDLNEAESRKNDIIELYGTIAFLKQENSELNREFHKVKDRLSREMESMMQGYEVELNKAKLEISDMKQELVQKQQTLHELDRNNKDLELEIQSMLDQKNNLEGRMNDDSSLKAELMNSKNESNKLKMELIRAQDECEKQKDDKVYLQHQFQELQKEFQLVLQNENKLKQEFQAEAKNTAGQMSNLQQEVFDRQQTIQQLTNNLNNLERNLQRSVDENQFLHQRCQQIDTLESDLRISKQRILQLEAAIAANASAALHHSMTYIPPPLPPTPKVPMYTPSYQTNPYEDFHHPTPSRYDPNPPSHGRYPSAANPSSSSSGGGGGGGGGGGANSYYSQPNAMGENNNSRNQGFPPSNNEYGSPNVSSTNRGKRTSLGTYDNSNVSVSSNVTAPKGNNSVGSSLASLMQDKQPNMYANGAMSNDPYGASPAMAANSNRRTSMNGRGNNGATPFATEKSNEIMEDFNNMERELTQHMSEKTSLDTEYERLQQRGLKTIKDRTRSTQIESRLSELSKSISSLRFRLTSKPG